MMMNFDGSPAFLRSIHNATPDGGAGDSSQGTVLFSSVEFTAATLNGRANCKCLTLTLNQARKGCRPEARVHYSVTSEVGCVLCEAADTLL